MTKSARKTTSVLLLICFIQFLLIFFLLKKSTFLKDESFDANSLLYLNQRYVTADCFLDGGSWKFGFQDDSGNIIYLNFSSPLITHTKRECSLSYGWHSNNYFIESASDEEAKLLELLTKIDSLPNYNPNLPPLSEIIAAIRSRSFEDEINFPSEERANGEQGAVRQSQPRSSLE